jgi:hypothetical protein
MMVLFRMLLAPLLAVIATSTLLAQSLPPESDTSGGMLRETMLGLLSTQETIADTAVRHRCVSLPVSPPNDRLQSPHGDSLLTSRCEVVDYRRLGATPVGHWFAARYHWTSLFTTEDMARGTSARDTVTEEEAVVFARSKPGQVQPVWHARYDTGDEAVWRSVTPELAAMSDSSVLLSVMSCVNGTGGCSQDFLQRHADGQWGPVWQAWLDQLPRGYSGRIRHGVRIDPRTLKAEAPFYSDGDPNCCPSAMLRAQLVLRADSLVLGRQTVAPLPPQ